MRRGQICRMLTLRRVRCFARLFLFLFAMICASDSPLRSSLLLRATGEQAQNAATHFVARRSLYTSFILLCFCCCVLALSFNPGHENGGVCKGASCSG